jgi:hypothetical protein
LQRPPTEQISAGLASTNESSQPTCTNCSTSTTPLWRRDVEGAVLCNACGLFLKLHKRPRPISLKTDVIKSRNRIKTARPMPPNSKKKVSCGGGRSCGVGEAVGWTEPWGGRSPGVDGADAV